MSALNLAISVKYSLSVQPCPKKSYTKGTHPQWQHINGHRDLGDLQKIQINEQTKNNKTDVLEPPSLPYCGNLQTCKYSDKSKTHWQDWPWPSLWVRHSSWTQPSGNVDVRVIVDNQQQPAGTGNLTRPSWSINHMLVGLLIVIKYIKLVVSQCLGFLAPAKARLCAACGRLANSDRILQIFETAHTWRTRTGREQGNYSAK